MKEKRFLAATLLLCTFVIWTACIKVIDVEAVGPLGSEVGFASLNIWFHQLSGVHMTLYTITDWLGLVPVAVCMLFAAMGMIQWVRRGRLRQVDYDILLLGVYYIIVIAGYLLFEMIPVNYRPIFIEGRLEASYPSSTTLLVLSVMPTLVFQANRRLQHPAIKNTIAACATAFMIFMVAGRLVSGVHWLTDIVGGALLSAGLFYLYKGGVSSWNFTKNCKS